MLIYMNGFEWGTLHENLDSYANINIVSDKNYVKSGNYACCISRSHPNYGYFNIFLNTPETEFFVQFAIYFSQSWPNQKIKLLQWLNESTVQGTLAFNGTTQKLEIYTGNLEGDPKTVSASTLIQDRWYYIELHIVVDNVTGIYELRVDGIDDCDFLGDTQFDSSSNVTRFRFSSECTSGTCFWYLDDVVINNASGDVNNSWVNCQAVLLLRPDSQGDLEQWDREAAANVLHNYECVDGDVSFDPEEFLFTEYTGKDDIYSLDNLPADVFAVSAIRPDVWASKSSGSARNLKLLIRPGTTVYSLSAHELNTYFTLYGDYWELNPAGLTSWTIADIDNLFVGIRSV